MIETLINLVTYLPKLAGRLWALWKDPHIYDRPESPARSAGGRRTAARGSPQREQAGGMDDGEGNRWLPDGENHLHQKILVCVAGPRKGDVILDTRVMVARGGPDSVSSNDASAPGDDGKPDRWDRVAEREGASSAMLRALYDEPPFWQKK